MSESMPKKVKFFILMSLLLITTLHPVRVISEKGICFDLDKTKSDILSRAVRYGCNDLLKKQIEKGKDVNFATKEFYAPIFSAINGYNLTGLEILLRNGANPNIYLYIKHGRTPLSYTISKIKTDKKPKEHEEFINKTVKLLIEYGANVNGLELVRNPALEDSYSPLHYAVSGSKYNLTKYLLQVGAEVNGAGGPSPIFVLSTRKILVLLVEYGIIINVRDELGRTPMHTVNFFGFQETIKELKNHGLDINAQADQGETPIMYAVLTERLDLVKVFVVLGVDLTLRNKDGLTVLGVAYQEGAKKIIEYLESMGAPR
ncbi:MAG: ankyrin repeat domain-containing protein [Leptospirales bacterium]